MTPAAFAARTAMPGELRRPLTMLVSVLGETPITSAKHAHEPYRALRLRRAARSRICSVSVRMMDARRAAGRTIPWPARGRRGMTVMSGPRNRRFRPRGPGCFQHPRASLRCAAEPTAPSSPKGQIRPLSP